MASSRMSGLQSMNCAYWDGLAGRYEETVLSVFDHDTKSLVQGRIRAAGLSRPGGRAADLGCGVGKFTPLLARTFSHVEASDFSGCSLAVARRHCRREPNITFRQLDLTCDPVPFAPADFVLCVNVLIMPSLDERLRAWRTVTNQVAHGGTLLLVVPSLESVHWEGLCAVDAGLDRGESCAEALRRHLPAAEDAADLRMGVRALEGMRTKHYLRIELERMLAAHHFEVEEVSELVYAEAAASPAPGSWDWLVVAKRL